jgi:hypothetical protein
VTLGLLSWASPAPAAPVSIDLLTSTHTVTLEWVSRVGEYPSNLTTRTTQTTTSATPVSDSLSAFFDTGTASAGLFEVSSHTNEINLGATDRPDGSILWIAAAATTTLTFAPVASGLASIDLTVFTIFLFSEAHVTLTDLTTASVLWSIGWERRSGYLAAKAMEATPPVLLTGLDASHVYQLVLFGRTDASDDETRMSVRVNGLEVVPEPSTLLLGVLGASLFARRFLAPHA